MAFTQNLRRLRLERFLSQGELARRADMHPITLTRLEAGSSAPSTRSVRALAAGRSCRATSSAQAHADGRVRDVWSSTC